jgi:regulatory protein
MVPTGASPYTGTMAPPRNEPRKPRPVTREWLFRAAAYYLGRYASTAENLRRVLERKVASRIRDWGSDPKAPDPQESATLVDATVAHFLELKLLDDRAFAEARLASLRRRGTSLRQVQAKLSEKGVERDLIAEVIGGDETDDRMAALAFARRRRLGPHRLRDRLERRDRDIAAMMRAGFGLGDARHAIDRQLEDGEI